MVSFFNKNTTRADVILYENATCGRIILHDNGTCGGIYTSASKSGDIHINTVMSPEDIALLRRIVEIDSKGLFDMNTWQGNKKWLTCTTTAHLDTCGTTFCIRGLAQAEYYIQHGKVCPNPETLYPRLQPLYFLSTEQARRAIQYILDLDEKRKAGSIV